MRLLCLISLWLAVVILSFFVGWFSYDFFSGYTNYGPFYLNLCFESVVAFAAIGVCAGGYIVAGLVIVQAVRSRRLRRGWAALLLLASAVTAVILPGLIILAIAHATQYRGGDYSDY